MNRFANKAIATAVMLAGAQAACAATDVFLIH